MQVQVQWRIDRRIDGDILIEALEAPFESFDVRRHRRQLLAHYDACEAAKAAGEPLPDDVNALTKAQHRTLRLLEQHWGELSKTLTSCYPARVRPHLAWTSGYVDWRENSGFAYVTFRGHVNAPFETQWDEHGIEAMMLGADVVETQDTRFTWVRHDGPSLGPQRLGPEASERDLERARVREERRAKLVKVEFPKDVPAARDAFLEHYFSHEDTEEVLEELRHVRLWAATQPMAMPEEWIAHDVDRLRALVQGSVLTVPRDILHRERDPEKVRRWVHVGVPVDGTAREGDAPRRTPLARHQRHPELFVALLELGADPAHLFDANGRPYRPLGEAQQAALDARKR